LNNPNKYIKVIILALFFIFFTKSSYAVPILRVGSDQTVNIDFDNRFGQDSSYYDTKTFYIYNDGNTSMVISSVPVSSPGNGITMSIYSSPSSVPAYSYGTVQVSLNVPSSVSTGTYTGIITVNTAAAGSGTMKLTLNVNTLIPAKLGSIGSRSTTIRFDKPKRDVASFPGYIDISLSNIGDSTLYIDNIYTYDPGNGVDFTISDFPKSISPRESKMVTLQISALSSAREGIFSGKISVTTSKESRYGGKYGTEVEEAGISVTIEHGINMEISRLSIPFGDTELLSPKEESIEITETLGYKSINNIKINKESGASKWLSVSPNNLGNIDPFGSNRVYIKLLYEGDANLYQKDEWSYKISTNNAGSKIFKVTATNTPPDVKPTLEKLTNQKNSNNIESREIAEKVYKSLKYADDNARINVYTYKKDELISLVAIANSAVNLLDSHAVAEASINNGEYDNAYEPLMKGVVAAKIISIYAEKISDNNVKKDIDAVNEKSSNLINILLEKETNFYESKKDSNLLESMIANERLSELWGILGDEEKGQSSSKLAREKFEQHNNYVDSAKNTTLEAENLRRSVQGTYLSKWGGVPILINPFYYSKVSQEYDSIKSKYEKAIQSYDIAGEKEMFKITNEDLNNLKLEYDRINSAFFVFTGFYSILFVAILSRSTKSIVAYVRDASETRMGDNFL